MQNGGSGGGERGAVSGLFSASSLSPHVPRASGLWQRRDRQGTGPDLWAVAGGKGGVGKSVVAGNLALGVAQAGLRCLLVDADLGGGNQHTLFGERMPEHSLDAFVAGDLKSLAPALKPSRFAGLTLAYTRCDVLGAANPKHSQKQKLVRHLKQSDFDVVVLDLGAGTSFNTLDLFLAARGRLVVTTAEPTAVQNAYGFIKCAAQRAGAREIEGELCPRVVVNLASDFEADYVFSALCSVTRTFMGREPTFAGSVRRDPAIPKAVRQGVPVLAHAPQSASAEDLRTISRALVEECFAREQEAPRKGALARGMNEELRVGSRLLHIQTEDLGAAKAHVRTQVFEGGRVIFSKELPYGAKSLDGRVLSREDQVAYQHRVIAKALLAKRVS